MDDLQERVNLFNSLRLPGQGMGMHMGTSYLVNDLWREVQQLRAAQLQRAVEQPDAQKFCTPEFHEVMKNENRWTFCADCGERISSQPSGVN